MEDTKLITYFTGEEVEVLRWLLEKEIDLLEGLGVDQDLLPHLKEMLHRIP